jgi:dihydrofolate reductase
MSLSIIVAVSENGVIGRDGNLPWHLSADLQRFKRLTMGQTIVMGRKTWESIGRPLPGRTSIVISRQADYKTKFSEVLLAASLEDSLSLATTEETFVIGGRAIYDCALPLADRLYLTRVHAEVEGDAFFPEVHWEEWELVEQQRHESDERNEYPFSFQVYRRGE